MRGAVRLKEWSWLVIWKYACLKTFYLKADKIDIYF